LVNKLTAVQFQNRLLTWFDQHGRKELPWQKNISPYRVWISEIMLQQTQVKTVIPYYRRFMQYFPTINDLAAADIDKVLHYWTGLGYYARARNLHKATKIIAQDFNGIFPQNFNDIIALPGIGRSTAGAICAITLQQHYAILDGNVKRVLARFAKLEGWPGNAQVSKKFWQLAEYYTPVARIADYTQAIMDLGATICTRGKPKCQLCPLAQCCLAHRYKCEAEYPTKKLKKQLPIKHTVMLLIQNVHSEWLLEKRPTSGIWGGLWLFPQCEETQDIPQWCLQHDINIEQQRPLPKFRHTFSHYHLDIEPVMIQTKHMTNKIMDVQQFIWYNHKQQIGLAAPVHKLLMQFKEPS